MILVHLKTLAISDLQSTLDIRLTLNTRLKSDIILLVLLIQFNILNVL